MLTHDVSTDPRFPLFQLTAMAAPTSPTLKDLPKVSPTVKSELEGFSTDKLKHTETVEKVVLPTKEGE